MRRSPPLALLCLVIVLFVGGFGQGGSSCEVSCGTRKIDPERAEEMVRNRFAEANVVIDRISCPESVEYREGSTFICTVKVENGDILEVELTHRDNGAVVTRSDNVVAMSVVEAKIGEMVAQNPATSARKFGAASCPEDKKAVKGATFRCTAPGDDGMTLLFDIVERDEDGNLNIKFGGVAVDPAALAGQLEAMLARKKAKAKVVCGAAPVSLIEKVAVSCEATDESGKRAMLEILPSSAYGDFDWRIVVK